MSIIRKALVLMTILTDFLLLPSFCDRAKGRTNQEIEAAVFVKALDYPPGAQLELKHIIMGSGSSIGVRPGAPLIVEHYQPSFLIMNAEKQLSKEIGDICTACWEKITSGNCEGYKKAAKANPHLSPLPYFYNYFYDTLLFRQPEIRPYFNGASMQKQGEMLVKTISNVSKMAYENDRTAVKKSIAALAERHNQRRIHPAFYSGFINTLLESIRVVMGEDYTDDIRNAWIITFSFLMENFMPAVIEGSKSWVNPSEPPRIPKDAPRVNGPASPTKTS